jgi:hypothetical protein
MQNITGTPVTHHDFLKTRLPLVEELKNVLRNSSVIIEAPRRTGKTSLIKELEEQEEAKKKKEQEFKILFFDLESEETVNDFCFKWFKKLLELYSLRRKFNTLSKFLDDSWNTVISRLRKVKLPGIEIELQKTTKNYNFSKWKEKITPLITHLNSFDQKTIFVFDEFPDMLMNFQKKGGEGANFKDVVDSLTAWLRSLRQTQDTSGKCGFVFCGSIQLRSLLEKMRIGKRIVDLESFLIPPIKEDESRLLIESLAEKYGLQIKPAGVSFMVSKITNGSVYYGQLLFKALRESGEKKFPVDKVMSIYKIMLRKGNHDLNHFHARLEVYLSPLEKECSDIILNHLYAAPAHEKEIYNSFLYEKCPYELFRSVVNRLLFEGYITHDINDKGKLRFVSPMLRDWWGCKKGLTDVCI